MNEPYIIGLAAVLLSVLLFIFAPHRYRHWAVLGFMVVVFLIVLIKLPIKPLFFLIAAVGVWFASSYVDR